MVYLGQAKTDNPSERGQSNTLLVNTVGLHYDFGNGLLVYSSGGRAEYRHKGLAPLSMPAHNAYTNIDSRVAERPVVGSAPSTRSEGQFQDDIPSASLPAQAAAPEPAAAALAATAAAFAGTASLGCGGDNYTPSPLAATDHRALSTNRTRTSK